MPALRPPGIELRVVQQFVILQRIDWQAHAAILDWRRLAWAAALHARHSLWKWHLVEMKEKNSSSCGHHCRQPGQSFSTPSSVVRVVSSRHGFLSRAWRLLITIRLRSEDVCVLVLGAGAVGGSSRFRLLNCWRGGGRRRPGWLLPNRCWEREHQHDEAQGCTDAAGSNCSAPGHLAACWRFMRSAYAHASLWLRRNPRTLPVAVSTMWKKPRP